jgi:anti-sigma factor RsiW
MKCDRCQPELSAYIDGELPSYRQEEIVAHLQSCPACRQLEAELRRVVVGVAGTPQLEPPAQFLADVRRKIRTGQEAPERASWWEALKLPAEALAVVGVLAAAFVLFVQPRRELTPVSEKKVAKPAEVAAPVVAASVAEPTPSPSKERQTIGGPKAEGRGFAYASRSVAGGGGVVEVQGKDLAELMAQVKVVAESCGGQVLAGNAEMGARESNSAELSDMAMDTASRNLFVRVPVGKVGDFTEQLLAAGSGRKDADEKVVGKVQRQKMDEEQAMVLIEVRMILTK